MAWEGCSVLAVVPARGGSKGIPQKNLRVVAGRSLVSHVALVVRSLPWIDEAVLSTDDEDIAEEGRQSGLTVPGLRPDRLGSDEALSVDVWRHAWLQAERDRGRAFDLSVLLEPTSPLRRPEDIEATVRALISSACMAAVTVSRVPAHYSPQKALTVSEKGELGYYHQEGPATTLRQRLPAYYCRNGLCYAAKREQVVSLRRIVEANATAVVIERPVVNIDEPFDLEVAQWLFEREALMRTNESTEGSQ